MPGPAAADTTAQDYPVLALTQQPPLRHWPLKAPKDLGGRGGAPPSGPLCSACCLCLVPLPAAGAAGAGDPPPCSLHLPPSLCGPRTAPTALSPFFQFSHAAEAQAPQDSKETVRGCLPI